MSLDPTIGAITMDASKTPAGGGADIYTANCQATDVPDSSEVRFLRFTVPGGKTLNIVAASMRPAGTGNLIVEVYDLTTPAQVYGNNRHPSLLKYHLSLL